MEELELALESQSGCTDTDCPRRHPCTLHRGEDGALIDGQRREVSGPFENELLRIAHYSDTSASWSDTATVPDLGSPRPNTGSCEKPEN